MPLGLFRRTRNPVPAEFYARAEISGVPLARVWGDEPIHHMDALLAKPREELQERYSGVFGIEHTYLAISGGGANGAFGAGLLTGWSETGTRPEFTMVTGISTGALIAPFAFLGRDYDDELRKVYTTYSTKDFVRKRYRILTLLRDAAASTGPLQELIARHFTADMLDAIAEEMTKGRALLVGTTNLDVGRPVLWNIGRIALGAKNPLELFHKVLLASAAIPAAFPPVFFEVEADGQLYDEMHVDGGGSSQVCLYPTGQDWRAILDKLEVPGTPRAFVIRNAKISPGWKPVQPNILSIAGRTISSLIRTQGFGDMYRLFLEAQRDGLDYHLAYIPEEFDAVSAEQFDPVYMRALFETGKQLGRRPDHWHKTPPGYEV
jgi:hypothetical protein